MKLWHNFWLGINARELLTLSMASYSATMVSMLVMYLNGISLVYIIISIQSGIISLACVIKIVMDFLKYIGVKK